MSLQRPPQRGRCCPICKEIIELLLFRDGCARLVCRQLVRHAEPMFTGEITRKKCDILREANNLPRNASLSEEINRYLQF